MVDHISRLHKHRNIFKQYSFKIFSSKSFKVKIVSWPQGCEVDSKEVVFFQVLEAGIDYVQKPELGIKAEKNIAGLFNIRSKS